MKPKRSSSPSVLIHQWRVDWHSLCSLFARHHETAATEQEWNEKQQVSLFELLPTPFSPSDMLPPKLNPRLLKSDECFRLCLFSERIIFWEGAWKVRWHAFWWNWSGILNEISLFIFLPSSWEIDTFHGGCWQFFLGNVVNKPQQTSPLTADATRFHSVIY